MSTETEPAKQSHVQNHLSTSVSTTVYTSIIMSKKTTTFSTTSTTTHVVETIPTNFTPSRTTFLHESLNNYNISVDSIFVDAILVISSSNAFLYRWMESNEVGGERTGILSIYNPFQRNYLDILPKCRPVEDFF